MEGRKMHSRKFPHTSVETKTTKEIWEELKLTFIRPRNVTFDRYLLLTRQQQREETIEQFHSALRSLAEHCQLGALEEELLRDIFTANMTDHEIQRELLKVTLSPERTLEVAIGIELGARRELAIQAKHAQPTVRTLLSTRRDEVMAISSSRYRGSNRPTRYITQISGRTSASHNCRNCGSLWTMDHKSKCQAMGQVCRRCNKPNHFAEVCSSNLNRPTNNQRVNEIQNSELENTTEKVNNLSLENDIQSQYAESDDDYTVNILSPENDKSTTYKLEIQFGNSK